MATYRAKCGHCDGKGYVSEAMRRLYGDCRNCNGTGWITDLSADDVAWFLAYGPERLDVVGVRTPDDPPTARRSIG